MYCDLGNGLCITVDKILGIFNIERSTNSATTRELLRRAEKNNKVTYMTEEIPVSFILAETRFGVEVFYMSYDTATLLSRIHGGDPMNLGETAYLKKYT